MKDLPEIIWIRKNIATPERCPPGITLFLFGSLLHCPALARDFDILVLYETECQLAEFKNSVSLCCLDRPVDLFFMTRAEERELGFVQGQECVQIYPEDHLYVVGRR